MKNVMIMCYLCNTKIYDKSTNFIELIDIISLNNIKNNTIYV